MTYTERTSLQVFGVQVVFWIRLFGPFISSLWSPLSWNTRELVNMKITHS